jgi:hypothetical protein
MDLLPSLKGGSRGPAHREDSQPTCLVCKEATLAGNDATKEHFDNFQRFYLRHLIKNVNEAQKHDYQYKRLSTDNCTRLVALEPGQGNEPIRCRLKEICINDSVVYSALSYVWGSPERKKLIEVDGRAFLVSFLAHW